MITVQKVNLVDSDEICIIDDSPAPMAITKKICERILPNVPIKTFPDVDSAITYLKDTLLKKRTIFLDLYMPHKDGWHFLDLYHPSSLETIYILSSSDAEHDLQRAREHNKVEGYLLKPLTLTKINELMH